MIPGLGREACTGLREPSDPHVPFSSRIVVAASESFFVRYRHFLLLLIYPLYYWGFQYVEQQVPVAEHVMHVPLDDRIPFLPVAIYPYLFWYGYIAIAVALTAFTDRKGFCQLMLFLYAGMGICYALYLIYPNGQNLRPALDSLGQGWSYDLLRWLYRVDTPTNCNPSIHVLDSIAVYLALNRHRWFARRPAWRAGNLVISLTIIASTVLVKQHSVVDLLCAGGLSILLYLGIMRYDLPGRLAASLRAPAGSVDAPGGGEDSWSEGESGDRLC